MRKKRSMPGRINTAKRALESFSPPQWVQEMHKHYGENGFYRADDLQRVLGDPRESVQVQACTDVLQSSRNGPHKK